MIEFSNAKAGLRHGFLPDGQPRPYKGYKGDSNYCIEIMRNQKGKWEAEVTSTFEAYQLVRLHGVERLRHPYLSIRGRPLVTRLLINDTVRLMLDGVLYAIWVAKVSDDSRVYLCDHQEANVDARNRDKSDPFTYVSKMAGSLQAAQVRRVMIFPYATLRDRGFKG